MAFRPILSRRAFVLPIAAGMLATSALILPRNTLHAEAPPPDLSKSRKPIYDDTPPSTPPTNSNSPSTTPDTPSSTSPSPTDRLSKQVGRARVFVHAHTALAEDKLNELMSRALNLEHSFTSTIASLAPEPSTHEKVLPGALYVLVAAMAGSIVVRNRNILLRATAPLAVGIGASWVVLPHTTRNMADLVWKYEERVPVLAMNHMRVRGAVVQGWKEAKARGEAVGTWTDQRVQGGREAVEGWVRKGK